MDEFLAWCPEQSDWAAGTVGLQGTNPDRLLPAITPSHGGKVNTAPLLMIICAYAAQG